MRKLYLLISLILVFFLVSSNQNASASERCQSRVILHYHRFNHDYEDLALEVTDAGLDNPELLSVRKDAFGQVYEIPICEDARDVIKVRVKGRSIIPYQDGVDTNRDGEIDPKRINVRELRDLGGERHVYLLQGAGDVIEDNPNKAHYFGYDAGGSVVVIYYQPEVTLSSYSIFTQGTGREERTKLEYWSGLDQGEDKELFRVGIINLSPDASDQISLIIRNSNGLTEKDNDWALELTADETDRFGTTYKKNGERLINVTDVRSGGFKFIYVINGVKTIFTDYNEFIEAAFVLDIKRAEFQSKKTLSVEFNKLIPYDSITGPNKEKFILKDQAGNEIKVEKVAFNAFKTMDKRFNLLLDTEIDENNEYTITYIYEKDGAMQEVETEVVLGFEIAEEISRKPNYTPYLVAGAVSLVTIGAGLVLLFKKK